MRTPLCDILTLKKQITTHGIVQYIVSAFSDPSFRPFVPIRVEEFTSVPFRIPIAEVPNSVG